MRYIGTPNSVIRSTPSVAQIAVTERLQKLEIKSPMSVKHQALAAIIAIAAKNCVNEIPLT